MPDLSAMKRIMIVGGPGSGKSTLALRLAACLQRPVVHMDQIYWTPGWIERSPAEVDRMALAAAEAPEWVFDGNCSRIWDRRAERAQMIIALDFPRHLRLRRVLWRSVRHFGRSRPDMAPGCPERIDAAFLRFCWNYDRGGRNRMLNLLERWRERRGTVLLRAPAETAALLRAAGESG